jgi:hypothetical protein
MVAIAFARNWHLSWWEWHVLMLVAFGLVALSARASWREERFAELYLTQTSAGDREISVLFADLEGFTSFSETHEPDEVASMLNEYFAAAVPAVVTPATGIATLSLEGNNLSFQISYQGLSGVPTLMHFHGPATSTNTAPPVVDLTSLLAGAGASGTIRSLKTLTADQIAALNAGVAYLNIHTAAHGSGEIRGQVAAIHYGATMTGAAEVPPVTTTATGSASLTLVANELFYSVSYSGLSSEAKAAHIHGRASATQPASVMFGIGNPTGTAGTLSGRQTLTADQLGALVDGQTYVNVHSATNSGGEIRGQIGPQ